MKCYAIKSLADILMCNLYATLQQSIIGTMSHRKIYIAPNVQKESRRIRFNYLCQIEL